MLIESDFKLSRALLCIMQINLNITVQMYGLMDDNLYSQFNAFTALSNLEIQRRLWWG